MRGPPLGPGGEDITWPDQVAFRGRMASITREIKPQTSNPSQAAPGQECTDTNRSSMEAALSMDRATPTKPALMPVQGRQRDGRATPHASPPETPPTSPDPTTPPPTAHHAPRTPDRPGHTGPPTRGQVTQSKAGG